MAVEKQNETEERSIQHLDLDLDWTKNRKVSQWKISLILKENPMEQQKRTDKDQED